MQQLKRCRECGEDKPLTEFTRCSKAADGHQYRCRPCASASARAWALAHPEEHLANMRRYMASAKAKETRRAYLERSREERRATRRDWYHRNREAIRERRRVREATPEWKEANLARNRAWREKNKERVRAYSRTALYGLKPEQYESLVARQGGCCAICRRAARLQVDHDHDNGLVRGLLCTSCNRGLGYFHDDPAFLIAAVAYLSR